MDLATAGVLALAVFIAGHLLGVRQTNSSWVLRVFPSTAHHCRGRFYYIVPEKDFCQMRIDAMKHRIDESKKGATDGNPSTVDL